MSRRDHEKLLAFLEQKTRSPFGWARSRNNCVTFAARAVKAQTGRDPLTGLKWQTLEEGERLLEREGGLEAAVDKRLRRIPPAMAQRGDVAGVADERFGIRLMIVEGSTLVGPGAGGNKRVPRAAMSAAWSAEALG